MAKRILAMLLVMAMVFSVLPTGVFAEGEGQQGQPVKQTQGSHDDSKHKCEHCDTTLTWTAWGDDAAEKTKLPDGSDGKTHYVLVDNIQVAAATYISAKDVTICLNGKQVTTTGDCNTFELSGTGKVRITDCTASRDAQGVYTAGTMTAKSGKVLFMMAAGEAAARVDLYDGILTGCTTTTGSVARVQGKCSFYMYDGEISGNTGDSGVVYIQNFGSFNMKGGEVKKNMSNWGGAFLLYGNRSVLNVENAKITGNTATGTGGAIYANSGTVTIKNSEISGNVANQGGAIDVQATVSGHTTVLTLDNAKVINNRTITSYGAVNWWNNGSTAAVVLKGETVITGNIHGSETSTAERNLYVRDHWNYITCHELSGNADVWLFVETSRINQTNDKQYLNDSTSAVTQATLAYLHSDKPEYMPGLAANGRLIMVDKPVAPEHPHKICNDASCTEHTTDVEFTKWTTNNSLPASGAIFLDTDVTLSQELAISSGELKICLNGHKIVSNGTYLFKLDGTAKVSITDCKAAEKKGTLSAPNGYAVYTGKNNTGVVFNLYHGIITGCTSGNSGSAANLQGKGTFNMYGGEISGNKGGGSGTIYMANTAKFNAYGGIIQNNKAGSGGAFNLASSGAVLTVDGATITNNKATSYGGAIMAASSAKVNIISGKITDNESPNGGAIYMSKKTTLTMTGGEISNNKSTGSGGAVYHLESTGVYSGGVISNNEAAGSGAAIFNNGATVTLSGVTVSDNTANNKGGAVYGNKNSKTTVQGGELTGNEAKSSGGAIYACEGAEVNLNGGKISKSAAPSGGGVYATDAGTVVNMNGGEVSENEASSGGGMLIASGTVLNLAAGKISGNKASSGAGLYMSKKSTVNMTGGEISGNIATGSGAGIYHLESTGDYAGGSITGNVSGYNGGAMFLNVATVKLGSVSITGNEAAASAGGIYPHGATDLTVTGDAVVQDNTANGKKNNVYLPGTLTFKVDNVGQNAKVGLSAATAFRFVSTANDTDYSKNFTSDRASLMVEYKDKKLYLGASGNHAHCLCDSNVTGCDHGEILFAAWDDPNSLPSNGNWYLNTDVTLTGSVDMRDVTLNLCLNGHTIKQTAADTTIFDVKGATKLNITDCADTMGKITGATKTVIFGNNNSTAVINLFNGNITGNSGNNAGAIFLQSNQVFNMYGGKIEGNVKESAAWGAGAIAAYYGNVQVNIYGGEISGNKSVAVTTKDADGKETREGGNAGAIYAEGNSVKINLHGGTISGNHADLAGGAVYAWKSTVNLLGTKLSGNTAGNKAGAVFVTGAAKLNLDGSELSGNSASNGGAVLIESRSHMEVTSGKVTGNKAEDGAGIYITTNNTFNMTGGEISGNIASGNGGGLALLRCEATVSGGTISENTAKYGGGMLVRGANLYLKGGLITKNTATNNGGGIKTGNQNAGNDVYTAKIVMTDGVISENTANYGGAVIVEGAGCEMLLQGGEIRKNTANYGGGLFVSTKTSFTMEGGKIADNTAAKTGGGMQMLNSVTTFTGGEISGNQCTSTGGGIYVNEKESVATFNGTTFKNNKGGYGGAACAANRGKIIFKSGVISGNTAVNNGGGLYISTNCVLDMYGGTITGNNVQKDTGGGLYGLRSTMNLYGGTVSYNTSKVGGGGIMVAAGTLNLMGADVLYNTAVSEGGTGGTGGGIRTNCQDVTKDGVKTHYVATINMTAGTVKGNKCGYGGGGILVNGVGATMKMSGGIICDNVSDSLGGGLYVSNKTVFEVTGGEISRNEAPKEGGGIWFAKDNEYFISNAKFSENYSGKNGGAVYMHNNVKCTYTNVEFTKNVAKNCGGAIFTVQDCNAIMKGCTFADNRSIDLSGGAVFLRYIGTVEDCVFTGNKSGANAGALYVGQSSLSVNGFGNKTRRMAGINISGSTFENNEAPALGGALYIMMSGYTDMKECTFKGNTAGELGTAIWAEEDLSMENVTITGNKGKDGTYAVYLAPSNYDGQSYFKGTMKMSGDMIISDNEGGDLYLAEGVAVGTTAKGYGQKTKIGVTLDSGVLTQRVYGAYNYEGGNCVYTITYGDRSLTDPEIDASLLTVAQDDAGNAMNIWLYAGVGVFVLAVAAVVVAVVAGKKKKTAKEAVEE